MRRILGQLGLLTVLLTTLTGAAPGDGPTPEDEASATLAAADKSRYLDAKALVQRARSLLAAESYPAAQDSATLGLSKLEEFKALPGVSGLLLMLRQVRHSAFRALGTPREEEAQRILELTSVPPAVSAAQEEPRCEAFESLFEARLSRRELKEALEIVTRAETEASHVADLPAWRKAAILRWKSSALLARGEEGDVDQALTLAQQSTQAAEGDTAEAARCLIQRARVLRALGQHAEAMKSVRQAQQKALQLPPSTLREELLFQSRFLAFQAARAVRFSEGAPTSVQPAPASVEQVSASTQDLLEQLALLELTRVKGRTTPTSALELLDKEVRAFATLPPPLKLLEKKLDLQVLYWKGDYLRRGQRYRAAIKEFHDLIRSGDGARLGDLNPLDLSAESDVWQQSSAAHLSLHQPKEALEEAEQCIKTLDGLLYKQHRAEVATHCYLQKGLALIESNTDAAREAFSQARQVTQSLLDPLARQDLHAQADLGLALTLLANNRFQEAQSTFATALTDLGPLDAASRGPVLDRLRMQWVHALFDRKKLSLVGSALFPGAAPEGPGSRLLPPELEALLFLQKRPEASWDLLLEGLRQRRIQCQNASGGPREECVAHLLATVRLVLAIPETGGLSDRQRLLALLEAERSLIQSPDLKSQLLPCWRALAAQRASIRGDLNEALPAACSTQDLRDAPSEALDFVDEELFASPAASDASPTPQEDLVSQLQGRLTGKQRLVRFIQFDRQPLNDTAEPRMGAFIVDKDDVKWLVLPTPATQIAQWADSFLDHLSQVDKFNRPRYREPQAEPDARNLEAQVWSRVFGENDGEEGGGSGITPLEVFIVPDESLMFVPFHALLDGQKKHYLVERFDIHYLPAAMELVKKHEASKNSDLLILSQPNFEAPSRELHLSKESMALGWGEHWDPFMGMNPRALATPPAPEPPLSRAPNLQPLFNLARSDLPSAEAEALAIRDQYRQRFATSSPKVFSDSTASERALRDNASRYAYIHIITHGFLLPRETHGQDLPELSSGLLLAGFLNPARSAPEDDGLFTALEARTLDLHGVHLITLSSCESGLGSKKGLAALGFRSAFFAAGAQNLVLSLWKINDHTTPELMTSFYTNLWSAPGMSPAIALTRAMRTYIQKHGGLGSQPYYWAPFIALGAD